MIYHFFSLTLNIGTKRVLRYQTCDMKYQHRRPSTINICFASVFVQLTSQHWCSSFMLLQSSIIAVSIRHTRHGPLASLRRTLFAPPPNPSNAPASSAHTAKSVHTPARCHWDPRGAHPLCTRCYLMTPCTHPGTSNWW